MMMLNRPTGMTQFLWNFLQLQMNQPTVPAVLYFRQMGTQVLFVIMSTCFVRMQQTELT